MGGTKINRAKLYKHRFFRVYAGDIIQLAKSKRMYIINCPVEDLRRPKVIQSEKNHIKMERMKRKAEIAKMKKILADREEKERTKGQTPNFMEMISTMKKMDEKTAQEG